MLIPRLSGQFKKDVKKAEKRGKDMKKLRTVLELLFAEQNLPLQYRDHPLKGEWAGFRDAHIEPDWLLIYYVRGNVLYLVRTGTHSDIFDE
ncbi:MAG: type II toxin-antitoxin system YafQ family toxin [Burkholderiales bacterium]|jgi:mRNA interferase YafQ|nr:type II toxin-antitoxin system YafQ family toxin [Burkholderiales bacterium]